MKPKPKRVEMRLSKILWKAKVGDKVISNEAFFKKFGYQIRGTIKSIRNVEGAIGYCGICFHKDGVEAFDIGWFRLDKP